LDLQLRRQQQQPPQRVMHPHEQSSSSASASKALPPKDSSSELKLGSAEAVLIKGFRTSRLNGVYTSSKDNIVQGQPTYWDATGRIFLYYQSVQQRWTLSPHHDEGQDLLHHARQGGKRGLAYAIGPRTWTEYFEKSWVTVTLSMSPAAPGVPPKKIPSTGSTAAVLPSPKGQLATTSALPESKERHVVVCRRDAKGPSNGKRPIRVWKKGQQLRQGTEAPAGPEGMFEVKVKRLLEIRPDLEEVLLLQDGERMKVSVRFSEVKNISAAQEIADQIRSRAKKVYAIENSTFLDFRKCCENAGRTPANASSNPSPAAAAAAPVPLVPAAKPEAAKPAPQASASSSISGKSFAETLTERASRKQLSALPPQGITTVHSPSSPEPVKAPTPGAASAAGPAAAHGDAIAAVPLVAGPAATPAAAIAAVPLVAKAAVASATAPAAADPVPAVPAAPVPVVPAAAPVAVVPASVPVAASAAATGRAIAHAAAPAAAPAASAAVAPAVVPVVPTAAAPAAAPSVASVRAPPAAASSTAVAGKADGQDVDHEENKLFSDVEKKGEDEESDSSGDSWLEEMVDKKQKKDGEKKKKKDKKEKQDKKGKKDKESKGEKEGKSDKKEKKHAKRQKFEEELKDKLKAELLQDEEVRAELLQEMKAGSKTGRKTAKAAPRKKK